MIKKHVLVVDDLPDIRDLLTEFLHRAGFDVTAAGSLASADHALSDLGIDLIICDGNLRDPGDGIDWATQKHLRGHRTIIFSGDEDPNLGVPFVQKQSGMKALMEKVRLVI